jgi:HEAT repeat protein
MKEYRELAKQAPQLDAASKEQKSAELAAAAQSETDALIRGEIFRTLGAFNTISSSTALYAGLQDSDPEIRIACCDAWGKRGGADAAKVLGEILREDESEDVKLAAARALGEIKDQAAVLALAPALDDGSPAMQWRAVRSLEKVTGKYYGEDVNAWRTYVQGGKPREESIVRRLGRIFY